MTWIVDQTTTAGSTGHANTGQCVCPTCGRCPTCGHPAPVRVTFPYVPAPLPWWVDPYNNQPWWPSYPTVTWRVTS